MRYQYHHLTVKKHNNEGLFTGYASVFGNTDAHQDVIMPGAFSKSLSRQKPKMLWQHNPEKPIGLWKRIEEDEKGLWVEGQIILDLKQGREAYVLLNAGVIDALSVGFYVQEATNGHKKRFLHHLDLQEISLVTFGANQEARIMSKAAPYVAGRLDSLLRIMKRDIE